MDIKYSVLVLRLLKGFAESGFTYLTQSLFCDINSEESWP